MNEWDLQARAMACSACQIAFVGDQPYHTLLCFGSEGYRRSDLCDKCWPTVNRTGEISQWLGVFQLPPPPAEETVKKETAESLLRKLIASDDPAESNARYILAVMLERKRILKPRESSVSEGGRKILVYEHSKTGESFLVTDPELRLDQLEEVQKQIALLLTVPKGVVTPSEGATTSPATS